jgi:hypothetical protein
MAEKPKTNQKAKVKRQKAKMASVRRIAGGGEGLGVEDC